MQCIPLAPRHGIRHCRHARRETANRRETFSDKDLCIRDKRNARTTCTKKQRLMFVRLSIRETVKYIIDKRNCEIYYYVRFTFTNSARIAERWDIGDRNPRGEQRGQKSYCLRLDAEIPVRDFLEFSYLGNLGRRKGPRESQPRKVGQPCLAEAFRFFFFLFYTLTL